MGLMKCRDNWAKTQSLNKDVKVYIGAPGSGNAAGSGYVDVNTLSKYAKHAQKTWSSFGGIMLWEMSLAVGQCESHPGGSTPFTCVLKKNTIVPPANDNYHKVIKSALVANGAPPQPHSPIPQSQSQTLPTPTSTKPPTSTDPPLLSILRSSPFPYTLLYP